MKDRIHIGFKVRLRRGNRNLLSARIGDVITSGIGKIPIYDGIRYCRCPQKMLIPFHFARLVSNFEIYTLLAFGDPVLLALNHSKHGFRSRKKYQEKFQRILETSEHNGDL